MKHLLPIACLTALTACSATAKQDATEPTPSGTAATSGSAPSTTSTASTTPTTPTTPTTQCPALQIKAPDAVPAGQVGQVSLIVTDAGGTPTYTWTVTGGTIESGQGTPTISVRVGTVARNAVTATVTLGNLPPECETKLAGVTFLVGA